MSSFPSCFLMFLRVHSQPQNNLVILIKAVYLPHQRLLIQVNVRHFLNTPVFADVHDNIGEIALH